MGDFFSSYTIVAILIAYLVGSIPSSIWVGKIFFGVDVRNYGSKNAGATNTFRTLGKKAGIPVLFFDIFKGWVVTYYLPKYAGLEWGTNAYVNFQLVVGVSAVLGHIFPIYERFKGGKGVATLLGIVLAINFPAAMVCLGIFLSVYLATQYVSLGAIVAAIAFPLVVVFLFRENSSSLRYFSMILSVLVVVRHRANIQRLLRNEEGKMPYYVRNNEPSEDNNV